jgi:hypothetical protein
MGHTTTTRGTSRPKRRTHGCWMAGEKSRAWCAQRCVGEGHGTLGGRPARRHHCGARRHKCALGLFAWAETFGRVPPQPPRVLHAPSAPPQPDKARQVSIKLSKYLTNVPVQLPNANAPSRRIMSAGPFQGSPSKSAEERRRAPGGGAQVGCCEEGGLAAGGRVGWRAGWGPGGWEVVGARGGWVTYAPGLGPRRLDGGIAWGARAFGIAGGIAGRTWSFWRGGFPDALRPPPGWPARPTTPTQPL